MFLGAMATSSATVSETASPSNRCFSTQALARVGVTTHHNDGYPMLQSALKPAIRAVQGEQPDREFERHAALDLLERPCASRALDWVAHEDYRDRRKA
jgi:hypothetical protein